MAKRGVRGPSDSTPPMIEAGESIFTARETMSLGNIVWLGCLMAAIVGLLSTQRRPHPKAIAKVAAIVADCAIKEAKTRGRSKG